MLRQRKRVEERRACRHWVHGRAEVMHETRQSQRHCSRSATGLRFGLEHFYLNSCLRQNDRTRQAIRTRSNDVSVLHTPRMSQSILARQCAGPFERTKLTVRCAGDCRRIWAQELSSPPVASPVLLFPRREPVLPEDRTYIARGSLRK